MAKASANVSIVDLSDGRQVCLSYGVIVAAFIPKGIDVPKGYCPGGYFRTDARFSKTTSGHMNAFAGKDAVEIPHEELKRLCEPVTSRL